MKPKQSNQPTNQPTRWTFLSLLSLPDIGIIVRVFAMGLGDQGSSRVIPKTQKMVLDATLLNTQCYMLSNPRKGVALSPTP